MSARRATLLLGAALLAAGPAAAQPPVPGHVEDWSSPGVGNWSGGAVYDNPGTGGVGGSGDGFLHVSTSGPTNLGVNGNLVTELLGDYLAAGITQVRLWLNDVDADDPLEIHLGIGNEQAFWQRNAAFLPPHQSWAGYEVDLDGPAGWTRTIGIGTWQDALQNVTRFLVRHDLAPYMQTPDRLAGQFGLDRVELVGSSVGVPLPATGARPLELRAPYPNPSRGPVTVAMVQHRPGPVRIEIVDLAGRRVRVETLAAGAGPRIWLWDGRDQSGRRAPAGAYRIRATGPDGGASQPLIRIE